MRKLFVSFFFVLFSLPISAGPLTTEPIANVEPNSCMSIEGAQQLAFSENTGAGNVLCCCRTMNGQCCNYVSFCGGFVPGCFCSGVHSEPSDRDGLDDVTGTVSPG